MSVRVMARVWERSQASPIQRLVLLAIADCANDRGTDAYPSTATLAAKTGLSERGVRKSVSELDRLGELRVDYKNGPRGCNRYTVVMTDPEQDAGNPARGSGNPEQDAGSSDTRHVVHPARNDTDTRHVVPGTRHETTGYPARGAPEPSENHPPTEPSVEPSVSEIATSPRPRRQTKIAKSARVEPDRPDVDRVCAHLADKIESNGSTRPAITARWRTAARLLLDADARTVDQVLRAIDWCQDDPFWRANVLSMSKLRDKYDQLRLQATRGNARASPRPRPSTTDERVAAGLALAAALQAKEITA